jgi:hypothetical protein
MDLTVGGHRAFERNSRDAGDRPTGGRSPSARAGRHHDALRQMRLGHGQLGAVEHPAVAHRVAVARRDAVHAHGGAGQAAVSMTSPATTPGSQRACSSGEPNWARGNAPSTRWPTAARAPPRCPAPGAAGRARSIRSRRPRAPRVRPARAGRRPASAAHSSRSTRVVGLLDRDDRSGRPDQRTGRWRPRRPPAARR